MTTEHLKPMCRNLLWTLSSGCTMSLSGFARGNAHPEVVDALRMGHMTALRKEDGGVSGIVVGDIFRTVVEGTNSQGVQQAQRGQPRLRSSSALSTRAGLRVPDAPESGVRRRHQ